MKEASDPQDVCSMVLEREGKFLFVQEAEPEVYGKWNLPGGHREPAESLRQAVIRECLEETGFRAAIISKLIVLRRPENNKVLNAFLGKIVSGKLEFQKEELLDAKWFTIDEILSMRDELRDPEYALSAIKASRL